MTSVRSRVEEGEEELLLPLSVCRLRFRRDCRILAGKSAHSFTALRFYRGNVARFTRHRTTRRDRKGSSPGVVRFSSLGRSSSSSRSRQSRRVAATSRRPGSREKVVAFSRWKCGRGVCTFWPPCAFAYTRTRERATKASYFTGTVAISVNTIKPSVHVRRLRQSLGVW